MRGPTIRSRYDSYVEKNGREYAASSFVMTSTSFSRDSTGTHRDADEATDASSSVPNEFSKRMRMAQSQQARQYQERTTDGDDADSNITEMMQPSDSDGNEKAEVVPRRQSLGSGTRISQAPSNKSNTPIPTLEAIRARLMNASQNPLPPPRQLYTSTQNSNTSSGTFIKAKLPFLADAKSDSDMTGPERMPGASTVQYRRRMAGEEGDDELGASDTDMVAATPLRVAVTNHRKANADGRSRIQAGQGYVSDTQLTPNRTKSRAGNGYLSDSTIASLTGDHTPSKSHLTNSRAMPSFSGELQDTSTREDIRSRMSVYGHSAPPVNPLISRLIGAESTVPKAPSRFGGNEARSDVPITYGGSVNHYQPAGNRDHLVKDIFHANTAPNAPTSSQQPQRNTADIHLMRALEQEAYGMEKAFEEAGGNPKQMLQAALSYYREGTAARALEKWVSAMRFEKVSCRRSDSILPS